MKIKKKILTLKGKEGVCDSVKSILQNAAETGKVFDSENRWKLTFLMPHPEAPMLQERHQTQKARMQFHSSPIDPMHQKAKGESISHRIQTKKTDPESLASSHRKFKTENFTKRLTFCGDS